MGCSLVRPRHVVGHYDLPGIGLFSVTALPGRPQRTEGKVNTDELFVNAQACFVLCHPFAPGNCLHPVEHSYIYLISRSTVPLLSESGFAGIRPHCVSVAYLCKKKPAKRELQAFSTLPQKQRFSFKFENWNLEIDMELRQTKTETRY